MADETKVQSPPPKKRRLLNILPGPIADRLKQGEEVIVDSFASVTVLFADLVGFSELAARPSPNELVRSLNEVFSRFDFLARRFGLEKIKTIGDAYRAVTGIPERCEDHAERAADMSLAMQVSENTERILNDKLLFITRGRIQIKGQGELMTYLLGGKLE